MRWTERKLFMIENYFLKGYELTKFNMKSNDFFN